MKTRTYTLMIAGSVPAHRQGSIDDSLIAIAQEALGVSAIHYLCADRPVEGLYHYLAIPSSALAHDPDPATALAAALPGHPQHRGPGLYVAQIGAHKAVVRYDGTSFEYLFNQADVIDAFLAEQTLELFLLDGDTVAWRFGSSFRRHSVQFERVSQRVISLSVNLLVVLGLLTIGLWVFNSVYQAQRNAKAQDQAHSFAAAVKTLKLGSPLAGALGEYEARSAVVVRAGGWIDNYQVVDGAESFRFFVPSWITPDYLEALGSGVSAERDTDSDTLLVLTKGKPPGDAVGSGKSVGNNAAPQAMPPVPSAPPTAGLTR